MVLGSSIEKERSRGCPRRRRGGAVGASGLPKPLPFAAFLQKQTGNLGPPPGQTERNHSNQNLLLHRCVMLGGLGLSPGKSNVPSRLKEPASFWNLRGLRTEAADRLRKMRVGPASRAEGPAIPCKNSIDRVDVVSTPSLPSQSRKACHKDSLH